MSMTETYAERAKTRLATQKICRYRVSLNLPLPTDVTSGSGITLNAKGRK
jgi:hypothetical protein